MDQLDHVPEVGDSFDYNNLYITVTETDYHRVEKIHVEVYPVEEVEEEEEE